MRLTALEEALLRLRYGSKGRRRTYAQIATRLGLSVADTRRLECTALRKLRHSPMAAQVWDEA